MELERRKFLALYERKYSWDMSSFEEDILSLKEPIYAVRPVVAFGLEEKKFLDAATRWRFWRLAAHDAPDSVEFC